MFLALLAALDSPKVKVNVSGFGLGIGGGWLVQLNIHVSCVKFSRD